MLLIKKTGEGYYLASLTGKIKELGISECHIIKREILVVIKSHREVTLDINGIKNIDKGGLKILSELMSHAENKKCKLRFINVDSSLNKKISELTGKKVMQRNEIDLDVI